MVQKRLGATTYQVSTPGHKQSSRVLHVNLLNEWVFRTADDAMGLLIRDINEEEEVEEFLLSSMRTTLDLDHLSEDQQAQVKALIDSRVFQEYPGHANLVHHDIVLKEHVTVTRMSYRVPEHLLVQLKEEVDHILSLWIIKPSKSEWCHPVVLVPKRDGTIKFYIDF